MTTTPPDPNQAACYYHEKALRIEKRLLTTRLTPAQRRYLQHTYARAIRLRNEAISATTYPEQN